MSVEETTQVKHLAPAFEHVIGPDSDQSELELSVIMPCLNEAETLTTCIAKAREALDANNVRGEILVADNGSTDGSQRLAEEMGARVVPVEARGYGNAL
ncbi:MAG TPA: glycosyltransferase, partial [Blastocatellia bacterium]|nr:glycosyltransferase [Blastocatellia bacterium]